MMEREKKRKEIKIWDEIKKKGTIIRSVKNNSNNKSKKRRAKNKTGNNSFRRRKN
jgi:hypothetical protein